MDSATKDLILSAVSSGRGTLSLGLDGNPSTIVTSGLSTPGGLDAAFDLNVPINVQMYLLPPVPLTNFAGSLWILPLVDARYWWQSSQFVSSQSTWAGLQSEIEAALFITLKRDTATALDANYGIPDACIFRNGIINTASAIDLYCWATNQRLVTLYNRGWAVSTAYVVGDVVELAGKYYTCTTAGTSSSGTGPTGLGAGIADGSVVWTGSASANPPAIYVLRSLTSAPTLYQAERTAMIASSLGSNAGGDYSTTDNGDVPGIIQFHFTNDAKTSLLDYAAGTVPAWPTGATLDVMCPATATGANASTLKAMADKWSNDLWQWSKYRFGWSWNGMRDWHFTGYEDYILYDQSRNKRGQYSARTFVKSLPPTGWGLDIVPLQLASGGNSCGVASGGTVIIFQLLTVDCADRVATAMVRGVPCGVASPAMGATITLCDAMGCSLLGPSDLLIGRLGFAQQMTVDGMLACSLYYDSDTCPWVILGLCPSDFSCT